MPLKLSKQDRITKPSEYNYVFKGGKLVKGKYWQVIARPNAFSKPKLGLAISKKNHRLAVDRNRFKRIARETFRLKQQYLDNWGFVVMARKSREVKNSDLSADLFNLLKKVTRN